MTFIHLLIPGLRRNSIPVGYDIYSSLNFGIEAETGVFKKRIFNKKAGNLKKVPAFQIPYPS